MRIKRTKATIAARRKVRAHKAAQVTEAHGLVVAVEPRPDGAARVSVELETFIGTIVTGQPRRRATATYFLDPESMARLLAEYGPERDLLLARRVPLRLLAGADAPGKLSKLLKASLKTQPKAKKGRGK